MAIRNRVGTSPSYQNVVEADERGGFFHSRTVKVYFKRDLEGPDSSDDLKVLEDYVHEHRKDEVAPLDYAILLANEVPRVHSVEVTTGDEGSLYYPEYP